MGIGQIGLIAPVVLTQGIFSFRRTEKGCKNFDQNPFYSLGNFLIGVAQSFKGIQVFNAINKENIISEGAANMIKNSNPKIADTAKSIKNSSVTKKFFDLIKCVGRNVNTCILGVELFNAFTKDDPFREAASAVIAFGGMRAGEIATEKIIGLPKTDFMGGKFSVKRSDKPALFWNVEKISKKANRFKAYCRKGKVLGKDVKLLRYLPGSLKSLAFVGASIGSYAISKKVANKLLDL